MEYSPTRFRIIAAGLLAVLIAAVAVWLDQRAQTRQPTPQTTVTRVCGSEDDGLDDGMTPCLVDCDPGQLTAKWCRPGMRGTWLREPVNLWTKVGS